MPVYADGWNENKTQYELSDGSYAVGLRTIGGIKYYFDENGTLIGTYTGWTRNLSTGIKNYYRNGKRCAGWRTINKKQYYFYYEGGFAIGDVQIENKIYTFDTNGVFTGKTHTPIVYTLNSSEEYYADNLPDKIPITIYYSANANRYFSLCCSTECFHHIERYENGKWNKIEPNYDYYLKLNGADGIRLEGRGDLIFDGEDKDEIVPDKGFIHCSLYHDRLPAGKYRAVFILEANYPTADEIGFNDMELYSYFTIK